MNPQKKELVSYTDDNGRDRFISLLPEQMKYYDNWRRIKTAIERGKLTDERRELAYENLEKCIKIFTYQVGKDEIVDCECGCKITKCTIARHRATKKHSKLMDAIENPPSPSPPAVVLETDMMCDCGMIISKANYARHIKNSRHTRGHPSAPQ